MKFDEFLTYITKIGKPVTKQEIHDFESEIGASLPGEYVAFLERCNGGYIGGELWFTSSSNADVGAGMDVIGGIRSEKHYSLRSLRNVYQVPRFRIPADLLWIMDDPFGNAICLAVRGQRRGEIFFWDHERELDNGVNWDGQLASAVNIKSLAPSIDAFVAGCAKRQP